jgi:hypothetical protein
MLVSKTARDLALILQRVRGFDAEFEGEVGEHDQVLGLRSQEECAELFLRPAT